MLNFFRKTDNLLVVIVTFFILIVLTGYSQVSNGHKAPTSNIEEPPLFSPIRIKEHVVDTVYTDKNSIIEIRLDLQKIFLHKRGLGIDTLLCSSGTTFIQGGMKTNHGIFVVKNKYPVVISKQFNNTKCLNWVGFNYGIGFHALENRGYYWSLGKRASSHGCVRLSQEDAKKLFDEVTIGTPVIVHDLDNARVVSFLPENFTLDTNFTKKELRQILRDRLSLLYQKKYFHKKNIHVVLTDKFVTHDGVEIGNKAKVPEFQNTPITFDSSPIKTCIQDHSFVFNHYYIHDSLDISYSAKDSTSTN
jgi:hypothetical protein